MKKIIDIMLKRLERNEGSVLVAIVQNEGSAPRNAGATMLVGADGYITGTIGGGMLEFTATSQAQEDLLAGKSTLRQYRLTKEEVAGLGMVCGGDVDVLFKVVLPTEKNRQVLEQIINCMNHYEEGYLALSLKGETFGFINGDGATWGLFETEAPVIDKKESKRSYVVENSAGEAIYIYNLENTSKVYIFGGGHLAQELVPVISHLGFRCIVTDDREEFSSKKLFPEAEEVHTYEFDKLDGKFDVHEQDYIIAMTRGHMGDLEVQKFAMRTPAYYIGVVGSRSKIAAVNEKLRESGFSDKDIARITTPIGVKIHSETPAEIAISIAAQLIEKRAEYKRR